MPIHERLEQWAIAVFGSQSKCAQASGMGTSQLNDYISNRKKPGADIIARWVRLGLNANWLLTGAGEMMTATTPATPNPPQVLIAIGDATITLEEALKMIQQGTVIKKRNRQPEVVEVIVRNGVPPVTSGDFVPLMPDKE